MLEDQHFDCCPICDGVLSGLPDRRRCPACDFRLGQDTRVIHHLGKARIAVLVFGCLLGLVAVWGKPFGRWEPLHITALAVCVLVVWYVIPKPKRRAIVGSDGVVLVGREEQPERFAWHQIAFIEWTPDNRNIRLVSRQGATITAIEPAFFGSVSRADLFVTITRHRLSEAHPPAAEPQRPGAGSGMDR